jgi:hypothetical protein
MNKGSKSQKNERDEDSSQKKTDTRKLEPMEFYRSSTAGIALIEVLNSMIKDGTVSDTIALSIMVMNYNFFIIYDISYSLCNYITYI